MAGSLGALTARGHRVLASAAIGLWLGLLGLGFVVVRPELAHSFEQWLAPLAGHLPHLTERLSLPVLGGVFNPLPAPAMAVSVACWALWLLPPLAGLRAAWRVRSGAGCLSLALGAALYLLLAVCLMLLVAFGLWLPFAAA
jgi:hypothetical protein